ncbi:PREDICTED: uncharacterized protein LOC105361942 [Ceratosolen solmsi marchali]|uniref:Uncharacterized protein LOC105361942 n=1 Tax=Ceratosolen solmsi marchali TaxID=326594 RepID=A0AAJ6YGE6_9HYME|nr:PREDICTED: uncharacterized protein LOC105361942 [Ceratosolen solmsi marchali]
MATDMEESDTDEHEKPGPAKRQRLAAQSVVNHNENNQIAQEPENHVEVIDEEEERRAGEKLRCWQTCQVAMGVIDNFMNCVFENCMMTPAYHLQYDSDLLLDNEMEDTAVTMAIYNHGLVRSQNFSRPPSLISERLSNIPQTSIHTQTSSTTRSSETLLITDSELASTSAEGDCLNDTYDSDHQQDFLDRAVAEAIKKKGLSTLSVDYG